MGNPLKRVEGLGLNGKGTHSAGVRRRDEGGYNEGTKGAKGAKVFLDEGGIVGE